MKQYRKLLILGFIFSLALLSAGCTEFGMDNTPVLKDGWTIIRPPSDVESLAEDKEFIWAGGKDGIYKINRHTFEVVDGIDCCPDMNYVDSVLVDKNGYLWAGFNEGAVRYDGKECILFDEKNGLSDRRVKVLYEDDEGRILIGTWGGVSVYDNGSWTYITSEDGLLEDMVNVIYQDDDKGMWYGSYVAPKGGVSYFKDGRWQYFTISDVLMHNNINAIAQDLTGGIWIGTGLYDRGGAIRLVLENGEWISDKRLSKESGLSGNKVRSLFVDDKGNVWFGSEYDGLAVKRGDSFRILARQDGLSDMEVKCFLMDSDNNLWIGTYNGITVISGSALDYI